MSKSVPYTLIRCLRAQPIQPEFSVGFTTLLAGLQKLHPGLRCTSILGDRDLFMRLMGARGLVRHRTRWYLAESCSLG